MKVRVEYKKGDSVRFLGHLDVARAMRMALSKAKWPVQMSQGFSPKPRISFCAPLPVGTAGAQEYFDVRLAQTRELSWLAFTLSRSLPEGFGLSKIHFVPDGQGSLEKAIAASLYSLELKGACGKEFSEAIQAFLNEESVPLEVRTKGNPKTVDLRSFVIDFALEASEGLSGCCLHLKMTVRHRDGRTIRPGWVLSALSRYGLEVDPREAIIDRRKILFDKH